MAVDRQTEFQEQDQQQFTQPNQNEIKLVPYVQLDGHYPSEDGWILSTDFMASIFDKIVDQGLLKTTFWEGSIADSGQFISMAKSPHNHMVLLFEGQNCVGLAWLSAVATNYAFGHFCLFKEIWGRSVNIGKTCIDYWFSWPGEGGPLLDVIVGIVPGFNHRGHKYVESLGFTRLGVIPGMFRDTTRNREDAVIYYLSR